MNSFKTKIRILAYAIVIVFVALTLPESADACPNCKDGLNANHISFAFGASILLMVSMPFLILTAWAVVIFKSVKSTNAASTLANQS